MEENGYNGNQYGDGQFGLPENYFTESAKRIQNRIEWEDEHTAYPRLCVLRDKHVFSVPENYFSKAEWVSELRYYPGLLSTGTTNPFLLPEQYFENSELKLFEQLGSESENELEHGGLLNLFPKQNNFTVEENYFARNENDLFVLLEEKPHARFIDFVFSKGWLAAAAILVVSLGFGVYGYFFNSPETKDCGTMACVEKKDLVKSHHLEKLDNEDLYELVNPLRLEEKLQGKHPDQKQPGTGDSSFTGDDLPEEI